VVGGGGLNVTGLGPAECDEHSNKFNCRGKQQATEKCSCTSRPAQARVKPEGKSPTRSSKQEGAQQICVHNKGRE